MLCVSTKLAEQKYLQICLNQLMPAMVSKSIYWREGYMNGHIARDGRNLASAENQV